MIIVTFIICNAFELIKKFKLVVNFTISNVPDNGLIYHPKHQKEVLIKHGFVNKKNNKKKIVLLSPDFVTFQNQD